MSELGEPANKKLRSSEPDLVVVVGDEEKEYHYHSQVMAAHSKVIDAMLSSSMRESQTGRIKFPDLSAKVWESMIYFLHPPAARQMTVQDALQVAAAYDKYDFCAGVECCDQVFVELFRTLMPHGQYDLKKKPDDLNQLIDVFLLADVANLKQTKERAVQYFKGALNSDLGHGKLMFCENQIKKLAPLVAKEQLLEQSSFTNDEILHSLFPKLFVTSAREWTTCLMLRRAIMRLRLYGTAGKVDGEYTMDLPLDPFESDTPVSWGGVNLSIKIDRLTDDWVIYGETDAEMVIYEDGEAEPDYDSIEQKVLWKNPFSKNMPLPPVSGWVPVDKLARGEPKIKYLYRKNGK
jgi:hypothetical protein